MYEEQMVVTQHWPNKGCKCLGLGYHGLLRKEVKPRIPYQPNAKCPCGSDKKYKKCCQNMIERMYKGGGGIVPCQCVGFTKMAVNEGINKLREDLLEKVRTEVTNNKL